MRLLLTLVLATLASTASAQQASTARDDLAKGLAPYYQPPAEFAGELGSYRSPLKRPDGSLVTTPAEWAALRKELLASWHDRLGPWPAIVEKPAVKVLESNERDGIKHERLEIQISPRGHTVEAHLLIPARKDDKKLPAVFVPFYEPLTSIGRGDSGKGTHDYGLQLVKRGFVTLSIGTPGGLDEIGKLPAAGAGADEKPPVRQPLTVLAYVAANCHTALAQRPEVDPDLIGIIGLSYGGKWSMFASCLHEKFACAVWSDPGIVFNEKNSNVNYWEPWYLGYDPATRRKEGVPSDANPRTGLYKELRAAGDDLTDLHALMAPRPVLVSGGTEDPPRNWIALNHLIAVNNVLGQKNRVAMTARQGHIPTPAALELELSFLEYWLKQR
jgi:hypothetical protein